MESTNEHYSNIPSEGILLLKILLRNWVLIFCFCGLSIIISVIFSSPYFIKPQYKSVVILYPPATNSNKILLELNAGFGADKDIDDEMQILESSIVRDSVIKKYHLAQRYESSQGKYYKIESRYENNVLIERTRFNSISITVYDNNPVIAARIANDIAKISDEVKAAILSHNLNTALHCIALDFMKKLNELKHDARKTPDRMINSSLLDTVIDPRTIDEEMKKQIEQITDIKDSKEGLSSGDKAIISHLNDIQGEYEEAASNLNSGFPAAYIISPAGVSDRKAYPVRSLIVIITSISSFLIISLWVIIVYKLKRFRALLNK